MKPTLSILLLTLLFGCVLSPPNPYPTFPEYYYGMTEEQFLEIYPKEIFLIGVPYHGGARTYYIPSRGVAKVTYNQKGVIRKITMRKMGITPYEMEIVKELRRRKKAVEEGKMTIDYD